MLLDILNIVENIMELLLIYLSIYLIKKYIFLEPDLEKDKQRKYHLASIGIAMLAYLVIKEDALYAMLVMMALNISIARKKHRVSGFILIIPMIGFVNGIIGPIYSTPIEVLRITGREEIIFSLIVYIVLFSLYVIFYFRANKWREQFENDVKARCLEGWEKIMIIIVGMMLMLYSYTYSSLPTTQVASERVINGIIVDKIITAVVVFVVTIMVIILVLQGNKKSYYYKKTLVMSKQMVNALAKTIDAKDKYTNGHSTRVAEYSVMIAKRMGYKGEKLEQLEFAALLHDIGKIGVPREIINKPSRLTDEEYEIIKTHPGTGANILEEVTELPDIIVGARWHHERYDGKGYPDKLSGENIPELARIIGVADAYDAMTSKRSYRDVLSQEIVKGEIEKGKGTQFDPEIAEVMLGLIEEDKEYKMHE